MFLKVLMKNQEVARSEETLVKDCQRQMPCQQFHECDAFAVNESWVHTWSTNWIHTLSE